MGLEEYKAKRKLDKTPEPAGGRAKGQQLHFVVQKHHASQLHYDFRLEIRGVLKSWAVPKGPSLDPSVKRLAMLVEDHPYDYKNFEGIIPEGNYGAGTVIIWDQGIFAPAEPLKTKAEKEKQLLKEFHSGKMKFVLQGERLKGTFTLVKVPARGENGWLLSKVKDRYAKKADVTKLDQSVVSGKTLQEMASDKRAKKWKSNRSSSATKTKAEGKKSAMPKKLSPMLCTLTKEPIVDEEYLHELKFDGYRIVSFVNGRTVKMHSRSGLDYTKKYPLVAHALKELDRKMVLDGEVVVLNKVGIPDFDALQSYNGNDATIVYYVFDVVWLDGYDLREEPLHRRQEILASIIEDQNIIRISESFDDGLKLYQQAVEMNLEGIVSKKKDSGYLEGNRGYDWLKTPTRKRQEFVIGGWAESDKSRSFRSLLFGAYNKDGKLEWIGRSGGGYKEKEMPAILAKLKKIETTKSPFVNKILDTKGAVMHYVKPQLVANFEFATWTKSGRIRKPATFLGFRKDKKATQVVREIPTAAGVIEEELNEKEKKERGSKASINSDSNWPTLEAFKTGAEEEFTMGDCKIMLTDVERELWKGVSKAKLMEYYHSVSSYLLPHLKDRPLSLHVKHKGPFAQGLYIKDMEGREPDCAEVFTDKRRHPKPGKRNEIDYLVCNNEATLLYMINLGCIDVNPWMSRTTTINEPDFVNIDLDPSDEDFKKVTEVALAAKQVLTRHKLKTFPKTSGKTGLHIYIPVHGFSFAQARTISESLGEEIHSLVPKISTLDINTNARGNRVFIDPSQNDYADTLAAPYSVRPNKIPSVSTPLEWKEIRQGLDPSTFTIDTILKRLKKTGDLFSDVMSKTIAEKNTAALHKLLERRGS